MQPIFTLNARGHVMLEVMRDYFMITSLRMRQAIQATHQEVIRLLTEKGIDYANLRSGLVPNSDKHEAAFIFDSEAIESSIYGREVIKRLLPLLDPRTTQSVLGGDLLGEDQDLILEILRESIVLTRSFTFKHGTLLFAVYINNLSNASLSRIHNELVSFSAYLGYIPTTFSSRAKNFLSMSMANIFLKHGKTIIVGHEDDRPNYENINITIYPLEDFGYRVVSLQSIYFGIFLSFKIECPIFKGFEVDSEMSLNAISNEIARLEDFTVLLEEAKHGYLINEKLGKLEKAGLADADRDRIALLIQSKVSANYIYNLTYLEDYDVMKFNIMIEIHTVDGHPTRMTAALEYISTKKTLRVITFY
ncbi:MAG: hypothetical protein AB7T38_06100 [Nitrospirales bacterium]